MALFLSTFENRIDKKGRVSVPSSFRAELSDEKFQGVVLFKSNRHQCLEGFPKSSMADISSRLDHFDIFSKTTQDDVAIAIFGSAVQLPLDGDGRIILPQAVMDFADLKDQACFVGLGAKFQIWSPELLSVRQKQAQENVVKDGFQLSTTGGHDA